MIIEKNLSEKKVEALQKTLTNEKWRIWAKFYETSEITKRFKIKAKSVTVGPIYGRRKGTKLLDIKFMGFNDSMK